MKLRKAYLFGLAVLAVAAVGVLFTTTVLAEESRPCFINGWHTGWFSDAGEFTLQSEEEIEGEVSSSTVDGQGKIVTPIRVRGMAGRGRAEGVGETVYWLDTARPVSSGLRSKLRGVEFPAVHEMAFHLYLTTEALPGKIFRSINPAVMVNDNATSFPPKLGSQYVLKNVVEFEDINEPGIVAARILSNHARYVGSRRSELIRQRHEN
jgi:hypothetical protein